MSIKSLVSFTLTVVATVAFVLSAYAGALADCGDPTGDGEITAADALSTLQAAVGLTTCALNRCDTNADGQVTAADALRLLQYAVGMAVTLNCGATSTTTSTTTTTTTLVAGSEFDGVDIDLINTLQDVEAVEQVSPAWDEPASGREYRVAELPVYYIRRDASDTPVKGYLYNFPNPPSTAVAISHSFAGLGTLHRYDDQMDALQALGRSFEFDLDIAGRETFVMAYNARNMDPTLLNTSIPYSRHDAWLDLFIHEAFHHYQFFAPDADWVPQVGVDELPTSYPVTADNIALKLLEMNALIYGRDTATTVAEKTEVLQQVLAIRETRMQLPEATADGINQIESLHNDKDRWEGSANYMERQLFTMLGNTDYVRKIELKRLDHNLDMTQGRYSSRSLIYKNFFWASGYGTGSTIMELVDEVSSLDWRSTFAAGGNPISVLETLYGPMTQADIDQYVADAQAAYDWQSILAQVAAIDPSYLD